ncbi:MAG: hypothetical protein AAFP79_05095 [Pseudomonadota bacterium]
MGGLSVRRGGCCAGKSLAMSSELHIVTQIRGVDPTVGKALDFEGDAERAGGDAAFDAGQATAGIEAHAPRELLLGEAHFLSERFDCEGLHGPRYSSFEYFSQPTFYSKNVKAVIFVGG